MVVLRRFGERKLGEGGRYEIWGGTKGKQTNERKTWKWQWIARKALIGRGRGRHSPSESKSAPMGFNDYVKAIVGQGGGDRTTIRTGAPFDIQTLISQTGGETDEKKRWVTQL